MKPLNLEITAFGPYAGTEVIDFRELGDKRFFLIHGPTGAGKTSVLDAMTYALYGATSGEERSGKEMRSLLADAATLTEVTFDFAVGDDSYRVWRQPEQERPKARGEGRTTEKPKAALWKRTGCHRDSEEGEVLATKIGEVDARIREVLGFDCDQFRQVVVLPQGRFREVLSADVKAREEILRQLFRTERFARITDYLKQRRNESRKAIEQVEARRQGVLENAGVVSREQLDELAARAEDALRAAEGEHAAAAARAEDARAALEAARQADALHKEARVASEALEALRGRTAAIEEAREDLARARQALVVEPAFEARRTARAVLDRALKDHADAEGALPGLERAHENACEEADAAESAQAADREIERLAAKLAEAERHANDAERVRTARVAESTASATLDAAREAFLAADSESGERHAEVTELEARWRTHRAAALAASLEPGSPCPVCGSPDHPSPATGDGPVVDDAALDAARERAVATARASAAAAEAVSNAERNLQSAAQTLASEVATAGAAADEDPLALATRAAELRRVLDERRQAETRAALDLAGCRDRRDVATVALSGARVRLSDAATRLDEARDAAAKADAAFAGALESSGFEDEAALMLRRRTPGELDALERRVSEHDSALAAATDRAERAARAAAAIEAAPDVAALEVGHRDAAAVATEAGATAGAARAVLEGHRTAIATIERYEAESAEATTAHALVARLADVADGSNELKLSLQRYVLGSYLDDVLAHANHRLQLMTGGRYRLVRSTAVEHRSRPAGLALSVYDEQAGEHRPAGTLSGGEGFLASLALALGLAEAVQAHAGGVKLETIFIDEGFGTLDPEALDTAITTLLELAGVAAEQGRLVGIISHVPELRQRIDARLEIVPSDHGSSAKFVV